MTKYHVFVHLLVSKNIQDVRGKGKREILDFLDHFQNDPFQTGDFTIQIADREVEVKVFGKYSIYYWADHAVKEIKVIEILQSDRR